MIVYLDTSCLLKLIVLEPESAAVRDAVAVIDDVLVSSLARLEAEVRLHAAYLGGLLRRRLWTGYREKLDDLLGQRPFRECALAGSLFHTALEQVRSGARTHRRSLDRLHLAAMSELRTKTLMTHDRAQAVAARALGYRIETPGRDDR